MAVERWARAAEATRHLAACMAMTKLKEACEVGMVRPAVGMRAVEIALARRTAVLRKFS